MLVSLRRLLIVPAMGLLGSAAAVAYLFDANPMEFVSQSCPVPIDTRGDIVSSGCFEVEELILLWVGFSVPLLALGLGLLAALNLILPPRDPD